MRVTIGRMQRTATFSGQLMATRFGMRSANITKSTVTSRNEQKNDTGVRSSGESSGESSTAKASVKTASPTTPPRMATALMPTCTTEKK